MTSNADTTGVILTGSRGLIGRRIKAHLEEKGYIVTELDMELGHDLAVELSVRQQMRLHARTHDHLINCFAFNDHVKPDEERKTILDLPLHSFRDCMEVNVTALFSVCKEYARLRAEIGGNIINFGATTGMVTPRTDLYDGAHKHIGYSTSKAAVIHMTRILATHLVTIHPDFRVNCISPGGVENDQGQEFQLKYGRQTPKGRMLKTSEILPAVDMLMDPDNSYMVGANIVVDGGWTVQ